MPFAKGNQLGKANAGRKREARKTIWVREELAAQGYDFEKTLVGFLERAAKGDKLAYDMAALLIKLVPHLANAPKNDVGGVQVETLVINRYDPAKSQPVIDTVAEEQCTHSQSTSGNEGTPAS